MVDNILPEPLADVQSAGPIGDTVYDGSLRRGPRLTVMVLIIIVLVALLSLVAGYSYDYLHTRHQDTVRKQDITYIANQAEDFYSLNHYYPTLEQFNSPTFAALQPNGLNRTDFKDPAGNSSLLSSSPDANNYAYEVTPMSCDNTQTKCLHFKLIAILSNDKDYVLSSRH